MHPPLRRTAVALLAAALAVAGMRAQSEELRESWQHVPELFAAANVHPGAAIADVGAGEGFLTVRLSPAVGPAGRVYAVDVDPKMTDQLGKRVGDAKLTNVSVILGTENDPHLPVGALDGVAIVNAYHEMASGSTVLAHIFAALKPGGRLVLCEPTPRAPNLSRKVQMDEHTLDPEIVVADVRRAGFEVLDRKDVFATNLGGTHFGLVVARRP